MLRSRAQLPLRALQQKKIENTRKKVVKKMRDLPQCLKFINNVSF